MNIYMHAKGKELRSYIYDSFSLHLCTHCMCPTSCTEQCHYTTTAHQTGHSVLLTMELKELTTSCSVQLGQIAIRVPFGEVGAQSLLYQTPHRRHTLCELIV